jgi:hypothetical protein
MSHRIDDFLALLLPVVGGGGSCVTMNEMSIRPAAEVFRGADEGRAHCGQALWPANLERVFEGR